jgi:hypothetical protein
MPIKVAPISSLSCALSPSISAARLLVKELAAPQTPASFVDVFCKP